MVRIYLSGRLTIEADGQRLGPDDFPGQQARVAFSLLVGERTDPVPRAMLADAIWPGRLPPSWDAALSSIVSKLRSLLGRAGLKGDVIATRDGCHELRLPRDTWVDHEAAADSIHEAEAALRTADYARAYGPSAVAHHIARRPFLAGEQGHWVEQRRERLSSILVRALECRTAIYLWNGEHSLAIEAARDTVALAPFRETAYQLLMRAHAASGNSAEALRVYERCRTLIAEELGVSPSPQTKAVHAELLQSL
ncbi:MAG: DNA-binding protein [Gemmatimonadetes bacterium]|nr:DNA-binding protein [Gemmatimonadota bacterium]